MVVRDFCLSADNEMNPIKFLPVTKSQKQKPGEEEEEEVEEEEKADDAGNQSSQQFNFSINSYRENATLKLLVQKLHHQLTDSQAEIASLRDELAKKDQFIEDALKRRADKMDIETASQAVVQNDFLIPMVTPDKERESMDAANSRNIVPAKQTNATLKRVSFSQDIHLGLRDDEEEASSENAENLASISSPCGDASTNSPIRRSRPKEHVRQAQNKHESERPLNPSRKDTRGTGPEFGTNRLFTSENKDFSNELSDCVLAPSNASKGYLNLISVLASLPNAVSYDLEQRTNVETFQVKDFACIDSKGATGLFTGALARELKSPEGFGKMLYDLDGRFYEGQWKGGQWDGCGTLCNGDGDMYVGEFVNGQRHGQGTYTWTSGKQYVGEFLRDVRHGKGQFTFPDGAVYVGDFENGVRQGRGRCDFLEGGYYEGEWFNNKFEGQGECMWPDGRSYKGQFRKSQCHGWGVEKFADGRIRHNGKWHCNAPKIIKKV